MTARGLSEVATLFRAAYGMEFDAASLRAWALLLADLSDEEGKRAAVLLCRTSHYPPKPADVIRLARGDVSQQSSLAWLDMLKALDPYPSYRFHDKTIPLVLKALGGLHRLAGITDPDELHKWVRKDFERLYVAYKANGAEDETGYIPGIFETENANRGFDIAPRVIEIGHPNVAALTGGNYAENPMATPEEAPPDPAAAQGSRSLAALPEHLGGRPANGPGKVHGANARRAGAAEVAAVRGRPEGVLHAGRGNHRPGSDGLQGRAKGPAAARTERTPYAAADRGFGGVAEP